MMLIPLLLPYMGSANRKWRPDKSRYSGLDLKRDLNNIMKSLRHWRKKWDFFLVKEAVVNPTPDEKTKGKLNQKIIFTDIYGYSSWKKPCWLFHCSSVWILGISKNSWRSARNALGPSWKMLGNNSWKKECFLSGIARITSPPPSSFGKLFDRQKYIYIYIYCIFQFGQGPPPPSFGSCSLNKFYF